MSGNRIYVAHGDLTQLQADAVAYSTNAELDEQGNLFPAFARHVPGFVEAYRRARASASGAALGDTFWLPLPGPRPRGVVAVVAVDQRGDPREQSRRAVTAAIERAAAELRAAAGDEPHLLVALPTFLAGTPEARTARRDLARAQVEAARAAIDRLPRVDVAFVAYTTSNYHIYLSARRELGRPPVGAEPPPPLVWALRRGECVVFVGAGLSRAAGLHGWGELTSAMARELGVPFDPAEVDAYLAIAEEHRARFGSQAQARLIERLYGDTRRTPPTLAHYLLGSLPLKLVITTNWDDLVERSLEALRRRVIRIREEDEVPSTGRTDAVSVVKLHGDATRPDQIVLSRDDFDCFFERRPAMALLLEGLLLNQTFFFVGYSLRDPNFRQIHDRIAGMLRGSKRTAFAVTRRGERVEELRDQQLELLPVLGDGAGCERDLLAWLDALAEGAAGVPQLFLTPTEEPGPSARLDRLRHTLLDAADEVQRLCASGERLGPDDARRLAATLGLLVALGWRPRARSRLWRLWLTLADQIDDPTEREHLLTAALACAENLDDLALVQSKLDDPC